MTVDDEDRVVDDRVIDMLSRKIKAELAHAAAVEASAAETRKLRVAEERRVKLLLHIVNRYANLGERVDGLAELLQKRLETDVIYSVLREWFEDVGREIDTINDRILLILELVRMVVPQAHQATVEQMVRSPDIDIDRRRLLRLFRQLRVIEGKSGPEFERLYEQIMSEIVDAKRETPDGLWPD